MRVGRSQIAAVMVDGHIVRTDFGPIFMKKYMPHAAIALLLMTSAVQAEVYTPQPGSAERTAILNAVRVVAGYDLDGPIEFVVSSLDVEGDFGFFMGTANRPGGRAIDLVQTPLAIRDEIPVDFIDGSSVQAFVKRLNGHWYIDDYAVGATDVWWIGPPYCEDYSAFLPAGACS